jgi:opacity protein-like surface antigen
MKRFLILAAIAAATATTPALAADVGVSVSIGEPGFYGRLDIGGYPQPQVMYRQPVIVEREVSGPPIYMRVPPGHAKNWRKHCREYNACGERVYFVQDNWYSREYVPRYQKQHRDRRDDRRGNNWNDDKGKGNGNGKGNGRGNGRD